MEGLLHGVRIVSARSGDWYRDRIGDMFEVLLEKDSESGLLVYVIEDTEHNRELLCKGTDGDSYLLNIIRDGCLTVGYDDCKVEYIK